MSEQKQNPKEPAKKTATKTQEVLKKVTSSKPKGPAEKTEVRPSGVTLVRR